MQMIKLDKKTLAKMAATVKRNNKKFKKLSLPMQRVQIARDVITQLNIGKLKAKSRFGYLHLPLKVQDQVMDANNPNTEHEELREAFSEQGALAKFKNLLKPGALEEPEDCNIDLSAVTLQTKCTVCGIGSMFVSTLEKCDDFGATNGNGAIQGTARYEQMSYMKKWFSEAQLLLVEQYFEGTYHYDAYESPIKSERSDKKRLIMIMENIISNKGKFIPNRGKHAPKEQ